MTSSCGSRFRHGGTNSHNKFHPLSHAPLRCTASVLTLPQNHLHLLYTSSQHNHHHNLSPTSPLLNCTPALVSSFQSLPLTALHFLTFYSPLIYMEPRPLIFYPSFKVIPVNTEPLPSTHYVITLSHPQTTNPSFFAGASDPETTSFSQLTGLLRFPETCPGTPPA